MKIISVVQNTPEWLALRQSYDTASEAPAALGKSKYTSRSDLIKQKATGFTEEVGPAKQALFDRGHVAEIGGRKMAEEILNNDLYPITATLEVDGLKLLASLDGATMEEDIIFEHKLWSESLAVQVDSGKLDSNYTIQMDQQLLISGAKQCLFMVSDGTPEKMAWCWYHADNAKFDALVAGWKQFRSDLAAYIPAETIVPVAAKTVASLPVVFDMRVEGKLVSCNLEQYKPAALAYIAAINTELVTDQNFADADADAKFCRDSAKKLELAIEQALGQMGDINQALGTVREIAAAFNAKGLALEKSVKLEKDNRKLAIVKEGKKELQNHESGLQERTQHHLPPTAHNFDGVIKNLRTITSVQNAVDTELARCKILANAAADKIQANLKSIADAKHDFLFADIGALVQKDSEYVAMAVKNRVADHQAKEAARVEAERERIRVEEQAKAERDAREKLAREQADHDRAAKVEAERIQREQIEQAQAARIKRELADLAIEELTMTPTSHQAAMVKTPKPRQIIPEIISPVRSGTFPPTRPTDAQIIETLALHFRVHESKVVEWLLEVDFSVIRQRLASEFAS